MMLEKSCGAIVYTKENNTIKYIVIRSKEGIYGFPKGHTEATETETATALREIFEETGLFVRLINGFRVEDVYTFMRNGELITKQVVYFLAEYFDQVPKMQESELSSIHLMDYESAVSVFQFPSSKRLLSAANSFLMQQ